MTAARSRSPPLRSPPSAPAPAPPSALRRQSWGDGEQGEMKREEALQMLMGLLPADTSNRLTLLVEDGTVRTGEFDPEAMSALVGLTPELQDKVLMHLESERMFLMSSRSKSGFLVATCDKARTGCLDSRGVGLNDPWRAHLLTIATPRRAQIELEPEAKWLQRQEGAAHKIFVDVSVDTELGVPTVVIAVSLTRQVADLKAKLKLVGITIPLNKMRIKEASLGWLRDDRSLAYYNLGTGSILMLCCKARGGVKSRKDQSEVKQASRPYCTETAVSLPSPIRQLHALESF